MTYSIYVEPGVYPFTAMVLDTRGGGFFVASISVDDVLVTMTGDAGWTALYETNAVRGPFTAASVCNDVYWADLVASQFTSSIGLVPHYIWTGSSCSSGDFYEYARFQYSVNVSPRVNEAAYKKIDFIFAADDLFIMRIGSGPPIVGSPRDTQETFDAYFKPSPTRYSLYLLPAVYTLKFSVANYDLPGYDTHLHGLISGNGSVIDVTSSRTGKWKDKSGNGAILCGEPANNVFLLEVEQPFVNTGIHFIGSGGCNLPSGTYDYIYTLTVSGPTASLAQTSSRSTMKSFVKSSSSEVASRPLSISSSFVLISTLSVATTQTAVSDLLPSVETLSPSTDLDTLRSSVKNSKLSKLFPSSSSNGFLNASPVSVLKSIASNRAVFLTLCFGAAGFFLGGFALITWRMRPKHYNTTKATSIVTSSISTTMATFSSEQADATTTQSTAVDTAFFNVLSVPAYLEGVEGVDFRVDKKLKNGGSADVMLGTAFNSRYSKYGSQVIVKRVNAGSQINEEQAAVFYQEIAITSYLQNCRNIVRILGYSPHSIILKMYPLGSLKTWLKTSARRRPKSMMFSFIADIGNGLLAMHRAGLIHCDLKSDNVLVDYDNGTGKAFCVLCDFGITQVCDSKVLQVQAFVVANRQGFSLMYAAPEVFMAFRSRSSKR
eukprot:Partr_v1_DN28140_c0_g1_i3_m56218